jgi:hypothetical protein
VQARLTQLAQFQALVALRLHPKRAASLVRDGLGMVALDELLAPEKRCDGCGVPLSSLAPGDTDELCRTCNDAIRRRPT